MQRKGEKMSRRVAIVTGAASGIGRAIAEALAEAGDKVVIADLDEDKGRTVSTATAGYFVAVDLSLRTGCQHLVDETLARYGRIDILVNNAGLSRDLGKIFEANPDGWEDMIDTNIKGLLYISRMVLLGMVERNSGHIINIGSIAGHEVYPKGHVYCATKFAVDAITKGMRMDLFDKNIRVSTIDPGLVETEFSEVRFYGDKERAKKVYQGYKALEAKDIAESVVWVATRPSHVQIAEMIILPSDQASAAVLNRREN